jgi:hypothetical protein
MGGDHLLGVHDASPSLPEPDDRSMAERPAVFRDREEFRLNARADKALLP